MQGSRLACVFLLLLIGCDQPDVIIEDQYPDIVVEHVYHCEEDTSPDIVYEEDSTPDVVYITEEDTTPDIVQAFYGDAANLPVLLWTQVGEPPMPKKLTELAAATSVTDADQLLLEQSGTSKRVEVGILAAQLPTSCIGGLITSNGTDAEHDIDIAPGVARDNTDVDNMRLAAVLTKQIDVAWAVGTDQGGLDTGAVAVDELYAIWLIKRSDTGVVDALFSLSFTAPTMPTDYDRKRLIGAVATDGSSNIIAYTQSGDYFRYTGDVVTDVVDSTITHLTWETAALTVPPNCLAHVYGHVENATTTENDGGLSIKTKGAADGVGGEGIIGVAFETGQDDFRSVTGIGEVLVDSNREIEYAAFQAAGTATVAISTYGFTMLTRRDP